MDLFKQHTFYNTTIVKQCHQGEKFSTLNNKKPPPFIFTKSGGFFNYLIINFYQPVVWVKSILQKLVQA